MLRASTFAKIATVAVAAGLVAACAGPQSVLAPAGVDALQISRLFWVMAGGAVFFWCLVAGLFVYVTRIRPTRHDRALGTMVIVGGGIAMPLVVVTSLLAYGLSIMPDQRGPGDGLKLRVTGEQWWWRVEYWPEGADAPVVSANEIRLPAGRRTEIELAAGHVIHSFWIPALGGKLDMFPGRVTTMSLEPTAAGIYRGQCTEFCGLSHAFMAFNAVVMEEEAFAEWLDREAAPARAAQTGGRDVFFAQGCGACHAIRGTEARGSVGPDLTHVASRTSLAAGILPMTEDALVRWIADPAAFKPGVEMPGYDHLSRDDLAALAAFLGALK